MNVWAFNTPEGKESIDFVNASLKKGISRFGWSYLEDADLKKLKEKDWNKLSNKEKDCYKYFLLDINVGDWIVHINIPEWGKCTAGKVIETYKWDEEPNKIGVSDYSDAGDFRHTFKLDPNTIVEFDRDNHNVTPLINRKLKLRGKYWRIYDTEQFSISLENLKNNTVNTQSNIEYGLYYLKADIKPDLENIAKSIQKNHPGKRLEYLLGKVFDKVPNVRSVKVNGSGFGTDYGADLIITYSTFEWQQKDEILVVQVKSFTDVHYEITAVEQIETAIKKYRADMGLIVSTAKASDVLIKKIEETQEKIKIPIGLMCCEDVAAFILKYDAKDLLSL
ncbi:MAG: restriction endonuclease [Chitinispirillales bacterium]|jgi:hypothetical protein|nr:restriction endonuclease [Chitinispirillales bacterium]